MRICKLVSSVRGLLLHRVLTAVAWVLVFSPVVSWAKDKAKAEVDFSRQIRPILAKHCYACHGPETKESGVALHDFEQATNASDNELQAIVPGDSQASELIRRIASDDPSYRMPPEGDGLTPTQVELLKDWIDSGAEYREHWSFLPLSDPQPPIIQGVVSSNPIDAFVAERWEKHGLQPSQPADARSLVRRLYFDCIGIPPDLETVERFAANPSEEAYAALVDELLADPRFGERMARDWLDVVRYAETNSFERDGPKPNAWKYRDYVIDSFNRDKPYSQFLKEQLAGDELDQPTAETLTATGFYRLGIWDDEPADPLQARFDEYDDLVTTIGQGMLGLTFNCARCHDHKIDPIPQKDYYQLVAFLRDVTSYGIRSDEKTNNQIEVSSPEVLAQNRKLKRQIREEREAMRKLEEVGIAKMTAEDQQAAKSPDRDKVIREKLKSHLEESQWTEYETTRQRIEQLRKDLEALPSDYRLGLAKSDPKPEDTFILMRGSPQAPGDEVVQPNFPKLFGAEAPVLPSPRNESSGRRTVLADWIIHPENRLTSRVIANRIWQHHFGRGIVRSANNFGQLGDPPSHPELLDFLAQQLIRYDWNLKPLHRLMLMSRTYRLSTAGTPESVSQDPNNDYFARFNFRRLSAEEIRDAVLTVNGRIHWQQHGPSIYPDVSDDVKAGQSQPGKGWGKSSDAEKVRRSVYIHIKRSLIPPELSAFDFPETDSSCEARFLTTQAAQALNMLNGDFMQKQSTLLARRAANEAVTQSSTAEPSLRTQVSSAIELAYSRPATTEELDRAERRIELLRNKFQLTQEQAFREYCLVLLNSNEFIYLD